jgi:hypothetical protein
MNDFRFGRFAVLLVIICSSRCASAVAETPPKPKPFIAAVWLKLGASGAKEVVIEPDPEKLKANGLTLGQLGEAVKWKRFVAGEWRISIDKNDLDLTAVAKLTVRELQAPPFTVRLRDGREVLITPSPQEIGHYVVTGEYFEQDVRNELANFSGKDPGKVHVLAMILVPGTVIPHLTEKDTMRHFSVGEPLETFAKVEVRDKPATTAR